MTYPKWHWRAAEQAVFLEHLTIHGDPVGAARAVGRPVAEAWRQRDELPAFAAAWSRAVAIAWEQVETRVLAALLAGTAGEAGGSAGGKPPVDSRLALELLKRRDPPLRRVHGAPVDGPAVSRLRAELREVMARTAGRV